MIGSHCVDAEVGMDLPIARCILSRREDNEIAFSLNHCPVGNCHLRVSDSSSLKSTRISQLHTNSHCTVQSNQSYRPDDPAALRRWKT